MTTSIADTTSTIFECPKCKETIDASAEFCRFCGAGIDREEALRAAKVMARINQACSDASYMRTCALAVPVFFVLRFVPFLTMLGTIGFVGLVFAIPIWAMIWWSRYASIQSDDADFRRARGTVKICGITVGVVLVLQIVAFLLGVLLGAAIRAH
jgi:hypothetical protein